MMNVSIGLARNGQGVFADKNFIAGDILFEVTGNRISGDEDEEIDEKTRNNAFRFDKDSYIDPGNGIGAYLNHSCDPNSFVSKRADRLYIIAERGIAPGEEIVIDYSTILASDDSWEMKCNCGSLSCRGRIAQFEKLPIELRGQYIKKGMVPDFILSTVVSGGI